MKYDHLSLLEREKLVVLRTKGVSFRAIGKELGRSHTSLAREWSRRAKFGKQYTACKAQIKSEKIAVLQRTKAPLKNHTVFLYVRHKLRDEKWSPETIAGRLSTDHPKESIHHETIYRYIYNHKKTWGMKLWQHLAKHRKRRLKKDGRKVKPAKYLRALPLVDRPQEVLSRETIGHWETDNLGGKVSDKQTVSGTTERKSRYTHLDLLTDKSSLTKMRAVRGRLTIDNGPENTKHKLIKSTFEGGVYSCQPCHSWEKGSVENMFGRVRRFIPKGTSLDTVKQKDPQNSRELAQPYTQKMPRLQDAL